MAINQKKSNFPVDQPSKTDCLENRFPNLLKGNCQDRHRKESADELRQFDFNIYDFFRITYFLPFKLQ